MWRQIAKMTSSREQKPTLWKFWCPGLYKMPLITKLVAGLLVMSDARIPKYHCKTPKLKTPWLSNLNSKHKSQPHLYTQNSQTTQTHQEVSFQTCLYYSLLTLAFCIWWWNHWMCCWIPITCLTSTICSSVWGNQCCSLKLWTLLADFSQVLVFLVSPFWAGWKYWNVSNINCE